MCNYCCNPCILKASSYTVNTSSFVINTGSTLATLCNGEEFKLITCATFPAVTTVVPVYININGTNYPVQDTLGNNLMSDQIRCRRQYCLIFGTNPAHFKLRSCAKCSQAVASSVATSTASNTTASTEVSNG